MCGFSGFVQFGAARPDRARRLHILSAMGAAIAHRGPDDEQFYDDGALSLVYRRLSIVDPSGGRQPLFNEDDSQLLVCNGEIYNHAELRQALAGRHVFRTGSDSEVMLHGQEEWQEEGVLQRARGMFALAHWDRQRQRLFLARDRLGIKPLYICHLQDGILFGSELKALLQHPDCPREMDWRDLSGNPIAQAITPSYIKGVEHLPGGSYLCLEPGQKARIRPYWGLEPRFNAAPFGLDTKRYIKAFDELLEESVAEHLQGNATIGLHLSGGVDSSLVAAIAAKKMPGLTSFTIVERSNFLAGDVAAASAVASSLGMDWKPVLFDYRTFLQDADFGLHTLEQSAWTMDSPLFDIEWILKRALNQSIRNSHPDLKVLLLGQGADEFAGGYSTRIDAPYARWEDYLRDEVQHYLSMGSAHSSMATGHHSVFVGKRNNASRLSPYQQMMQLMPRQLQHHNLWHEDRTSACFGMEARVPFLDHRLVELLASVPAALHKKLFWNKFIVRQSLRKRLPGYDYQRPKIGFCFTDDSRSLDILLQNMALAASDAFRDKYLYARDYPFDRSETVRLMQQVRTREPGFNEASIKLLGQMSATIFHSNVHNAAALAKHASPLGVSRLEVLSGPRMDEIGLHFAQQPVIPFDWLPEHCPRVPMGCRIAPSAPAGALGHHQLKQDEHVHAQLQLPQDSVWAADLMAGLTAPAFRDFTVRDWAQYLGVSQAQLADVLDTLLQCGFVTRPEAPVRRNSLSRASAYLRHHWLHATWLRKLHPRWHLTGWMEWLKRRRQLLESELRK